jgi:hypothetical protein
MVAVVQERQEGHIPIYIDLRTIGSTNAIYSDSRYSTPQRATRLLLDTFETLHNALFEYFVDSEIYDLSVTGPILDRLANSISEISVVGKVEQEVTKSSNRNEVDRSSTGLTIATNSLEIKLDNGKEKTNDDQHKTRVTEEGVLEQKVQFGPLGKSLADISKVIAPKRIWILLDEWSSIPIELQPYLADLLRRSVFPVTNITVKIAAIEQRTNFRIFHKQPEYIGFELGADIAADLDLDDFMVFDNDAAKAVIFFKELLFKHIKGIDEIDQTNLNSQSIEGAFISKDAFEEFVQATEGIPRDAINIIKLAAQKAMDRKITKHHVRDAARTWYQRDKEVTFKAQEELKELLRWIIDEVIDKRKARAFMLSSDSTDKLVDDLFDARVIHILKKNISARDQPGKRFNVYKLDYGCYVDLINTSRAPGGLLATGEDDTNNGYMEIEDVPKDDYRTIRRSILNMEEYAQRQLRLNI